MLRRTEGTYQHASYLERLRQARNGTPNFRLNQIQASWMHTISISQIPVHLSNYADVGGDPISTRSPEAAQLP